MKRYIMLTSPVCVQCKTMYPIAEELEFDVIDVMQEPEFAPAHGIRGALPVFLVMEDNKVINRIHGPQTRTRLLTFKAKG